MKRKVKHRILGILVVIGLVVILLPFFQQGKDIPSEPTSIKAPPFPDQSVQVTSISTPTQLTSDQLSISTPQSTPIVEAPTTADVKTDHVQVQTIKFIPRGLPRDFIKTPIDHDGLVKLKGAVYVIQIGSFKNKTNALRLVNHLRANGYKAFIQRISTALGNSTRVFVGPEYKQTSARILASRLESDMHLHGIVISYKPLTL